MRLPLWAGVRLQTAVQFHEFGFRLALQDAINALGYKEPTPVQAEAIPLLLAGKDVIGSAQTGTGKTAAFALPILHQMSTHLRDPRCLILEPTRELAVQTEENFKKFARFTNLRSVVIYGGVGYDQQRAAMKAGVDVIVATPGRLLDLIGDRTVSLSQVKHLVLDEADRMLDMGFLPDVKRIVERCPKERQTALFSATIPPAIQSLVSWAMKDPVRVEVGGSRTPAETVKHVMYPVAERQKNDLLLALLEHVHYESVIVFCRTRRGADEVENVLRRASHKAAVIHSDRSQGQRQQALEGFKAGRYEVLVATDIAARGLDIADVSHVINYDVPEHPEDYVHRIGRTGRAMATGDALTIMTASDAQFVAAIERFISQKVPRLKLDNFTYQYTAIFDEARLGPLSERRVRGVKLSGGGYSIGGGRRRR
jgi:ATP-dependent RNA helicase RhlE